MNPKIRIKDIQSAQGMVEFALVLPILLLVILGIFAFGHMFFVYSSVVSASREAARWGSAVGEAPSSLPRYQDCAAIRAAAVRVGAFAGVDTASVAIDYDHGPVDPPPAPVYANCPMVGNGPDSTQVERGDRIVVRVTVQYTPIVPLVDLPSFPITAETARTIVKSVPVGDAPVAVSPCLTETQLAVSANPANPPPSVTGQWVTFSVHVGTIDPSAAIPTGSVTYELDTVISAPVNLDTNGDATFPAIAFQSDGDKLLIFEYTPDNICHTPDSLDFLYYVDPAATTLTISDPNDPSQVGNEVAFTVQLTVTAPGAVTTGGPVGETLMISENSGICTPLSGTLLSTCTFTPNHVDPNLSVTVSYPGSANYLPSDATELHQVNRLGITLTVNPQTSPIDLGDPATFFVQVTVPSGGVTVAGEQVAVSSSDGSCTVVLDSSMSGSCSFTPTQAHNSLGITASYPGSANYDPTTDTTSIQVVGPVASNCPTVGSMGFSTSGALQFQIRNTEPGNVNQTLSSIQVTWPNNPDNVANLTSVRFGGNLNNCTTNGQPNCVWQSSGGLPPTVQTLSSGGPPTWHGNGATLNAGASKDMRIVFSYALPAGNYRVDLTFGSCSVAVTGSR